MSEFDLDRLWLDSRTQLLPTIESRVQQQWLDATQAVGFSGDVVVLATPNAFARNWLVTHCRERIAQALSLAAGRELGTMITVQPHPDLPAPSGEPPPAAVDSEESLLAPGRPPGPVVDLTSPPPVTRAGTSTLIERYTFDDFVIGASNRFAHAAAAAVAEAPARAYNPLFVYGVAGLGKTHLLHAVGNYVEHLYPRLSVLYVTSEDFLNDFITAIRNSEMPEFRSRYRQRDLLLIDDIQFLGDKEGIQEEFFHTFNTLHNAHKQIVIASDRPPKQISQLEERLRSRFEWGLQVDIQPPDLETRIAILEAKVGKEQLGVPGDVLRLIASKVDSNIRELEGALIRVNAYGSLQNRAPDLDMATTVLKDVFPTDREQPITPERIMSEVADYYSFTVEELCSPSRSRQLTTARQIAMYLVRELTDYSLPRIGREFGGRDHTTVLHANKKIAKLMSERRPIYDQVQELTNRIRANTRAART